MGQVRRALTWVLALPLIVVGSQVAHGLAYWWAYPIASVRDAILAHSGHGYLSYAPILLSFLAGLELLVLLVLVWDGLRGNVDRRLPPWVFLWLPLVGFALQEHLERFIATGSVPWWTVESPTFWRGLVLQLPLGLLAYGVARVLCGAAGAVAAAIGRRRDGTVVRRPSLTWRRPAAVLLPRTAPLALGAAGRAPPFSLR
jgi:hypothetical protein